MAPRTGRPKVENPINKRFSICLDQRTLEQFEAYCKEKNLSKSEAVRKGILLLLAQETE